MVGRKGVSLPINTLVILAIAIIVLLAIVAFFMGAFTPGAEVQKARADFNKACGALVNDCSKDPDTITGLRDAYCTMNGLSGAACTGAPDDDIRRACGCVIT
ncbi:MAG: hypothetical protein DRP11_00625 [Candidatus Aenigmatarchaeota archaeon]|nr:MAG: hypothetical protein DRP11_00625 [Candidatus Aenigmarchaeota archaeon]